VSEEFAFNGYQPEEPTDNDPSMPIGEATVQRLVWELMSRVTSALIVVVPKVEDSGGTHLFHSWAYGQGDHLPDMATCATMEVCRRFEEALGEEGETDTPP
jgi:hypothetical protein